MRRDLIETNEGSGLGSLWKTSVVVPMSKLQEEKAEQVSVILSTTEKGKIKEEKEPEEIRQPELLPVATKNTKTKDIPDKIPYLSVPKNLGGELKNTLLKIIWSKISPAFLEKTSLKMMTSALIIGFVWVAIEVDISLLGALWWYAEKYTIIEGLQWYGSFLSRFSTKDMLAFSAISLVFIGAFCLWIIEFLCTLNVGKFSKIITDHKTGTMHYHIERNAQELKEAGYFGMSREIQNVLKDTVDELYTSGRIQSFDTIVLHSYLLTNEWVFRKLRGNIEKILPFAQITEMPERPLGKNVKGALEIRNIKERWGEYLSVRDTLAKRVLAPLVCSRKLGTVGSFSALVWHGLWKSEVLRIIASPFMSKNSQENSSKKQFSTTRWICIKLPKERRENKNSL